MLVPVKVERVKNMALWSLTQHLRGETTTYPTPVVELVAKTPRAYVRAFRDCNAGKVGMHESGPSKGLANVRA